MAAEAQTCAYGIEHPESRLVLSEVEGIQYRVSSIENPTLAHFRHFSSLYTNEYRVSRYESFLQNKPNLLNAQINVSSVLTKDYNNEQ